MKNFISKVVIFLIGLVVLDFLVGVGGRYLVSHAKGGDTGLNNYICHHMKDQCIIFGSSRGMHHYDPDIIQDSLGMSCWNCSLDGNGIILMYGRYKMLSARYVPKLLIYDVQAGFDLLEGDNHSYLGGLRYYYDESGIDSIFWNVDYTEKFKMLSSCYRYNSCWLQLISDNIHPLQNSERGYRPVDKKMQYKPSRSKEVHKDYRYDKLKLYYLEKLVKECKANGTKLIFAISPQYETFSDKEYQPLKELCRNFNIPLLNHFCDKGFVRTSDYFYDSMHMNRKGASLYTRMLVGEVKGYLNKKNKKNGED